MANVKFIVALVLVGLAAFCFGFGLYKDYYSGFRMGEDDDNYVETRMCMAFIFIAFFFFF